MIKTASIITLALLATTVLSSCSTGCINCRNGQACQQCFRRYLRSDGTCGSKAGEHCDIYSNPNIPGNCSWCSVGYALGYNSRKCISKTVPKNCVSATYKNGYVACAICENATYPSTDGTCNNYHTNKKCMWAGLQNDGRTPSCFRCVKGWAVDQYGNCQPNSVKGCLFSNSQTSCTIACNPWASYFMYYTGGRCTYKWFSPREGAFGQNVDKAQNGQPELIKTIEKLYDNVVKRMAQ